MGIDARLRDENGDILDEVLDLENVLSEAYGELEDTRLLKYLVPWGTTVFNQSQSEDLMQDLRELGQKHVGSPLERALKEIEPLVARLSAESHVYLWFVGD